ASRRLGKLCNDPGANVFVEPVAAKNEVERYAGRNQQDQDHSQSSNHNSLPGHNTPPLIASFCNHDDVFHVIVRCPGWFDTCLFSLARVSATRVWWHP